ncbi:unnamed protein product [Oikopleura dioica]|uniref:Uncharacterized protein n=1 Tax=Oikopleura dioica TaxID=34765 RepID=E4XYV2_OIKDI|nr:unnamed protein product [Oikopleura dioica]
MDKLTEEQIEQNLLDGSGGVAPPETDSDSSSGEGSEKSNKLITAIKNGLAHLDVESKPTTSDRVMTDKTMVKLVSDDDESEAEAEFENNNDSFAASAQHRQANRSKMLKDEQQIVRNELLAGCSPGKFAERFPTLTVVRTQTMRDCAAADLVEKVVEIANKLEKINVALRSECNPYQPGHTDILRELTLAAAATELIHALTEVPQDAPCSRWRIEVAAIRNLVVATESPLIMTLKFTHQRFKNT